MRANKCGVMASLLFGACFLVPVAHAEFVASKTKAETVYRATAGWNSGVGSGSIVYRVVAKKGEEPDSVMMSLSKAELYEDGSKWPWRDCNVAELDLDGEISTVREAWPPTWDTVGNQKIAMLFLATTIDDVEKLLVSKNATYKVCDDRIEVTPGMRLDLMKLRDAYRKTW
ncbi:hypothetical protein [Vogesella oryzae]|uniref:hypothetical protein n=1 Tax=Vogesella oryzae TaxID=1735285 RepID=UPI0015841026|nr:hypothetical protein [Vogesella oryzae]